MSRRQRAVGVVVSTTECSVPPMVWSTPGKLHVLVRGELVVVDKTSEEIFGIAVDMLKTVSEMNAQKKRGSNEI